MRKRREWAVSRLFEHYEQIGIVDPVVRLGEILLLLPEIEVVCDLHCTDFQVAKLFQFCGKPSTNTTAQDYIFIFRFSQLILVR